jgi:predicted nucleic acid-binding protein
LPNDALILAICKEYGINCLATHDQDFEDACKAEKIVRITNVAEFLSAK